jgi:hypothetical protein
MPNVFICYRREDSAGHAGWLRECLGKAMGSSGVLMDLDAIEPGEDFEVKLRTPLFSVVVVMVLTGPRWVGVRDAAGELRLHRPDDYVRREIAEALKRRIFVIPVLVWGAQMAHADELPDDIRELSTLHAFTMIDRTWAADVDRLVKVLRAKTFNLPPESGALTVTLAQLRRFRREAALDERLARASDIPANGPSPPDPGDKPPDGT